MTREEFKAKVSMALSSMERETWEDFLEAVWQLHLEASNQWIPVEERLPEENERVRAWSLENNEEYLCDYHDGIFEDFYGPFTDGKITHWMPIVPPRKEE